MADERAIYDLTHEILDGLPESVRNRPEAIRIARNLAETLVEVPPLDTARIEQSFRDYVEAARRFREAQRAKRRRWS